MLTLILALKAVLEIALLALLGRWVLGVLAGAGREGNLAFQLLSTISRPAISVARWIAPRWVLDRHLSLVAFLVLGFAWMATTLAKISHCQAIGVASCL